MKVRGKKTDYVDVEVDEYAITFDLLNRLICHMGYDGYDDVWMELTDEGKCVIKGSREVHTSHAWEEVDIIDDYVIERTGNIFQAIETLKKELWLMKGGEKYVNPITDSQ